jgi:hypothetical protein
MSAGEQRSLPLGSAWCVCAGRYGSAEDLKNRDIFEERVEMVLRCWHEESLQRGRRSGRLAYWSKVALVEIDVVATT